MEVPLSITPVKERRGLPNLTSFATGENIPHMKTRSLLLISILSILWIAANGLPQDGKSKPAGKPDFSGTWVFDKSKSKLGQLERTPLANAAVTLVIAHKDPELKITQKASLNGQDRTLDLVYYSDGRGETNPPLLGSREVKSKTKWDGNKLASKSTTQIDMGRGGYGDTAFIDTSVKRELSEDGKTLTITTSTSGPRGTDMIKQVFNRTT